ncbi:hypothetical protein [Mucilaginibacter flavidus]|uniref:hypothetical protein n=1 Tax=Mucilaginibacter flavidus TaxID=2949309 RepID=UPI0020933BDE|nr:hypothetical protein [Mucilaginibacter flavidus]MCO5946063.1 hypothetical protein [Mucilaginibacter flavidus]
MKQRKKNLLTLLLLIVCVCRVFAQPTSDAEAKEMAQKLMRMTPAQIMKFRDSMMKAVMNKQAKVLPNGKQLLLEHHYDTTYTTVRFNYTRNESQHTTAMGGHSTIIVYAKSAKAAMLYEANGHTIISCSLNPPKANTAPLDKAVKSLDKNLKYMPVNKQVEAVNTARMAAFGSMTVNNNSLTGLASENGLYSADEANTIISTKPPVISLGFSFDYDPVEGFSTIGVGGTYHRHTDGSYVDEFKHLVHGSSDDVVSAGMGATTDPAVSHLTGAATPQKSDPDAAYIKVTKTARGFNIKWTKRTTYPEVNGVTTEELNADIGEPDEQYEAVIRPFGKTNYEHWLPKGPKVDGSDDSKGDDSSRFYIRVRNRNDTSKIYPGNYTVKWALHQRTNYRGFNSNYPLQEQGPNKDPDMKFSDSVKMDNQIFDSPFVTDSVATTQNGKGNIGIVRIMCMDYGAWGKLYATVTLDDGTELQAAPYYDSGKVYITIPFDKDDNKIADAWERKVHILNKGYDINWDEDVKPDNHRTGDNIPLIDEYRGFLVEDDNYKPVYARLSPEVKELFTIGLADKSAFGEMYKAEIKTGAMGYSRITEVKVYHYTNSKYGMFETGDRYKYGRWINFNSPSGVKTHGVAIFAYDTPNEKGDPNALGSTKPIFDVDSNKGYNGAQTPDYTDYVELWTYNLINLNDQIAKAKTWYLPANTDNFHLQVDPHILHVNAQYHLHLDPATFSNVVAAHTPEMIKQIISFTIAHEICHATNIRHHQPGVKDGAYEGVSTCPVRYWLDFSQEQNHADWLTLFFAGKWNPATLVTPDGYPMGLCTTEDNCFYQLKLK